MKAPARTTPNSQDPAFDPPFRAGPAWSSGRHLRARRLLAARSVAAAAVAALALGACRGGGTGAGGGPIPDCGPGSIELVVTNERPLRVRVLEQSPLNTTRILGELPGRETRAFTIQNHAGMIYSVQVSDTGELIAAENAHPRGFISRGATISRQCD